MKKRYFTAIFVILILTFLYNSSVADEIPIPVKLNGVLLNLESPAINRNGNILLPLKDLLSEFKASPVWYSELRQITCAHNNMFAKMFIGKKGVYLNGNLTEYDLPVELIDGTAYAPVSFYCDFLSLSYNVVDETVSLTQRDNFNSSFFGTSLFTETMIPNQDLIMALPFGWKKLPNNSFGVENPYEKYSFTVNNTDKEQSPSSYRETLRNNLPVSKSSEHKVKVLDNVSMSELVTNDRIFYCLYYSTAHTNEKDIFKKNDSDEEKNNKPDSDSAKEKKDQDSFHIEHHAHYICSVGNLIYDFHFIHNKNTMNHTILSEFEHALNSVKFPPYYFNSMYENYIEYDTFTDISMELSSKINSNHETYDGFIFEGKCDISNDIEILAEVKKNNDTREFVIQIDDKGNFYGKIYTPFGVGKHQVTIFCKGKNEKSKKEPLLSFSVINLSGKDIKYMVPGKKVRSRSVKTQEFLNKIFNENSIDRPYESEYEVAKTIFNYLENNINIGTVFINEKNEADNSEAIMEKKSITETEANILFASLMRGSGIRTRIVKSTNRETKRIYCESLINGEWRIYDIAGKIFHRNLVQEKKLTDFEKNVSLIPEKRFIVFSYVKPLIYDDLFNTIEYLDY